MTHTQRSEDSHNHKALEMLMQIYRPDIPFCGPPKLLWHEVKLSEREASKVVTIHGSISKSKVECGEGNPHM